MSAGLRYWLPRWLGGSGGRGAFVASGPSNTLDLRFADGVAQSRMRRTAPDVLVADYTRTMLAALLWRPAPRRIGIVGLGGGSQAKFLYRHFPQASIEALEISPEVLALRGRFHVPPDDERFTVRQVDAAAFLPLHPGRYDLMLVDAYDETGIPAVVSTPAFHAACHGALTDGGALSSNLYCDNHAVHFGRLRAAFNGQALRVEEPRQSNRVASAWKGAARPHDADELLGGLPREAAMQLQAGVRRVQDALVRSAR